MRFERDGFSIEAGLAKGRAELPEWYLNEPHVLTGEEFYLSAFEELGSTRHLGMAIGPIPWTAMMDYAAFHRLSRENAIAFVRIIRIMDGEYLKWVHKKNPGGEDSPPETVQH